MVDASTALFPAATTTTTPLRIAYLIARSSAFEMPSEPKLRLMTRAPFWTA